MKQKEESKAVANNYRVLIGMVLQSIYLSILIGNLLVEKNAPTMKGPWPSGRTVIP
jgi:hypothetical protein